MVATKRRPHILKYSIVETPAINTQNADGDWQPTADIPTVNEVRCKFEPNGSGRMAPSADGNNVVYNGIIYLDQPEQKLAFGHKVEVYNSDEIIFSGTVLNFSRGSMNARLWV